MRVGEDADESDAGEMPRISRSEYKKMQSAADRAKTLGDRKRAAKETLISIALRYVLPSVVIYFTFIVYEYCFLDVSVIHCWILFFLVSLYVMSYNLFLFLLPLLVINTLPAIF